MKKHFSIKPFIIAAAIMTTGAVSVLGASAATKNTSDLTAPVTITYLQSDSAELSENTEQPVVSYTIEALAEVGTVNLTDAEVSLEYHDVTAPFSEEQKTLYRGFDEDGDLVFEVNGVKVKPIGNEFSNMEFICMDENGTVARYRIRNTDATYVTWSPDGSHDDDWIRVE